MKVSHHPAALDEIVRAAEYFDEQVPGLGARFVDAIDAAVLEIARSPLSWPLTKHRTRKRILISPFPYTIHYKLVDNRVVVVAIAHQSREPEYWKGRLK
jgi:plasmid stabilization system protein ParE